MTNDTRDGARSRAFSASVAGDDLPPTTTELALDFPLREAAWRLLKASVRSDGYPFAYLVFNHVDGRVVSVRVDLQKRALLDPLPNDVLLSTADLQRLSRQIIDTLKRGR